ncbi:glucose-1-phosphate adenylyltransferase [Alkalihalobacillus alcalophilus ATCC 27647 = CGMCC 1.3604]|uniref:Glucose-1-phosphate adenylyltransferase n=2 Tax=Alkalihalobacillus alcalophilus ATCC 27647 = CGMCC 1.3604 TaxID=1218173 RepID=A0A4S4K243_ALKAL|nr:glucose-1-phosphate adenylyltransferase [Alkalihalobacillus alcalophilus]MED1561909.1 glucose-1-phosphate adenylyltransferase [Alkalihalobacillus alcalophilus]THG90957.1 glucose-1-phosphate adenylyltransferase [Alkalihalobacillus alcalophilus ATCC 27647 = CGMCC 1.3604]
MLKNQKNCIAMLLAGGEGKRLGDLTKRMAKPAVHFGGKYRIIDFALSNCSNSGIDTVGVLTQYEPLALNAHLGIGSPWDLDRRDGGLRSLPPYIEKKGGSWYQGTANAILQNIPFIEQHNPEHVLILSGDHIYKMDYSKLIDNHKKTGADATISVIDVPLEEASRFGIMETNASNEITGFKEKPEQPTSTLASMGVYVFKWPLLKKYLLNDAKRKQSSHDFGKDIIPMMLADNQRLLAYPFTGYWRDVGTIESYWQANMDLVGHDPKFNLNDPNWKIYSVTHHKPPHYLSKKAKVSKSIIDEGCRIAGTVKNSIIFNEVSIESESVIDKSVIMPNVSIGQNVQLSKVIVTENTTIPDNIQLTSPTNQVLVLNQESLHQILVQRLVSNG